MNASSGQPSMRDRKKRRRAARARLFRSARARAFREHPVVCWASIGLFAIGVGLLVTNAALSSSGGGLGQPWLARIGWALLVVSEIWLVVALRLGPFSPKRKSRAAFWKGTRILLLGLAAWMFLVVTLVGGAVVYWAKSLGAAMGQSVPSVLREQLWRHDGLSRLLWHLMGWTAVVLVMLYAAHRLGPVIRRLEGKCVRCGYMLRGLPEPRCPECGTPFNPADLEEDRARQESVPGDRPGG